MTADNWKKTAADRRDTRATKTEATSPGKGRKKDTKRWCKGVSGREHVTATKEERFDLLNGKCLYLGMKLYCTVCGKDIAWWSGRSRKPKPDWAKP